MALTPLGIAYDHAVGLDRLPVVMIHTGIADRRTPLTGWPRNHDGQARSRTSPSVRYRGLLSSAAASA